MNPNPYASYLADAEPIGVLERTSDRLRALISLLSLEQIESAPAPGKWSVREVVAHLADCEIAFAFRLRQTLSLTNPELQPFDQEVWSERYAVYDLQSALTLFEPLRTWNLRLIKITSAADRSRPAHHPERGALSFWTVVETTAGHDINHLQRLEDMVARTAFEAR